MKNSTIIYAWLGVALIVTVFYNFDAISQYTNAGPSQYCAKMHDGELVVFKDDYMLTSEVVLENGTKIRPDATVIRKDGTTIKLEEEQCILEDGQIVGDGQKEDSEEFAPPVKPN